ncbi:hypothetical protein JNB62_03220 [Microbacterium jejuense]|uniref:Uncharacterized protein n=1 Tax=Microbacterium jejuense TaxID=1263637 RepID=A0ABS7HIQ4_9MICO|nr:DUF6578 domain-containing protein [Microbacterium jejuense]MBW9092688.1 hypothetical protein [Microbacterium jejuense]
MTRVWLTEWEWACCGDPFAVGDDVDLGIAARTPGEALAELLGPALAATVDAVESHHEEEFPDRVRGRVVAVHGVTQEVIERRTLRRPGHGAPLTADMPAEGEEWPMTGQDMGNGLFVGTRPTRYVVEIVPVPDSAELAPARGVRLDVASGPALESTAQPGDDAPGDRRSRAFAGWLVDVEEPA